MVGHGMALERKEDVHVPTLLSRFLPCFLLTCLSLGLVLASPTSVSLKVKWATTLV